MPSAGLIIHNVLFTIITFVIFKLSVLILIFVLVVF